MAKNKEEKTNVVRILEAAGIPCIILWEVPDESVNYIGIDNARSIYTSVKYLIDLGHKRIGFLVGPMTCARRTIDRMEGYKKVLADNGIPFDPELIRSQPPSYLLGKESMRAFLKLQDPPTIWPSGPYAPSPRRGSASRRTFRSAASTTSTSPPTSTRR